MKTVQVIFVSASLSLAACGGATSTTGSGTTTSGSSDTTTTETTAVTGPAEPFELPAAGDLPAAIAGAQRSEENRARDRFRHPRETLTFFGIEPGMRVVEISPGGGWYTEILAPYLRESGTLVAAIPSAEGSRARYRQTFVDLQTAHPEVFGAAELATFDTPDTIELGADGSADMVLTFRNIHGMVNDEGVEPAFAAFFRVLRPGGVLGVVQHRAPEGSDPFMSARGGYVPEAYVIDVAQRAGFVLEERSEINANPNDDHDHPEGVWTLPPSYRLGDTDRAQYEAIGESDRMTLRFRKPAE
ncbi:MAG: class I SAM-dependent methyltransferase [Sandaracinaceae bacterium]|nr:class I SAM-dependent methyltransferase [Sandaracinaceae bacterium]